SLSPMNPLGISNKAYADVNAKNTHPIWSLVSPRSLLIRGAACPSATRSIYVMIAKVTAKKTTQYRTFVGLWVVFIARDAVDAIVLHHIPAPLRVENTAAPGTLWT